MVVAALLLAAGALALSSSLTWIPATGPEEHGNTGGDLVSALLPLAGLALAAVAAVLATSGLLRRIVGVLIGLAGLWSGWLAVAPVHPVHRGLAVLPDDVRAAILRADTALSGQQLAGRGLVGLGAVSLLYAAVLLVWRGQRMPKLGARYQAPGEERPPADPDRELWERLDRGEDPTERPSTGSDESGS